MPKPKRIFSGEYSELMWDSINKARTVAQLHEALYLVCCRLQELEAVVRKPEGENDDSEQA